ncbi:LysR family transcriptional regulator [Lysobacter arenosi]|uniref:LysR family transcriptional regulator n=1 Tax=Lysobacter arenosi TaxID=2795387 RepID=A0ABX7R8Y3_9GAMM|nr:LysR family transcriptional regulator [Lysobacter arenosi]QSX73876.1 LysR family transcriptional regulator [Lysobacter arenosi]
MNLLNQMPSLIAFVRSVEAGSFSAAARIAGMTPSAVSKGIGRLEGELGAKLFRRSTRHLSLTPDGQAFFERVAPLLRGIDDSADAVRAGGDARGVLRISMPGEIGRLLLEPITRTFLARHEGLELDMSLSDRHVEVIREGYDVVYRVGVASDSELKSRTLAQLDMVLVASPVLLARHGVSTLDELREIPFVRYLLYGRALPITFNDGTSIQPRGRIGLDTGAGLRAAALNGMGVAHLMKCTVQDDLDKGDLVEVMPHRGLPPLPLRAMHAFGNLTPARVRLLTEFIADEIQRIVAP